MSQARERERERSSRQPECKMEKNVWTEQQDTVNDRCKRSQRM